MKEKPQQQLDSGLSDNTSKLYAKHLSLSDSVKFSLAVLIRNINIHCTTFNSFLVRRSNVR